MRSVHTQFAQQTDSHVVLDTAAANAGLRSLELALRRSQRHVLYFGHWSWCCVGHSRHWCTVLVHWRECCAGHSRCSCRICFQSCRHRFVHAWTWNDNWCASALHAVTHDDGAIDAQNNDTHVASHKVERHTLQTTGEFHQVACLHTLSPQVRAESVQVTSYCQLRRWRERRRKQQHPCCQSPAMPLKPLEKIHRLACLQTLQPVSTSTECSGCAIEAQAERRRQWKLADKWREVF